MVEDHRANAILMVNQKALLWLQWAVVDLHWYCLMTGCTLSS